MYTCIDVGASNGCFSLKYINTFPNMIIYAFEPDRRNFNSLIQNTKNTTIISFNCAIHNYPGIKKFYSAKLPNTSSLLEFVPNGTEKWIGGAELKTLETYDVIAIRLDDFIAEKKLDIIDFLKIDTQGNDLNVIKSLGEKIINVKEILAEVQITDFEIYKNSTKKTELIDYMYNNGFEIYNIQKWSFDQEENICFINKRFNNFLNLI